jgi:hypothetical protein
LRHPEIDSRRQRPLAAALALAVLLGGCAATQPHPQATAAPPSLPVQAACVDPAQIPPEPPMVGSKFNGDAKHDLQVLAPNAKALRDWGEQLHAMLQACAPKPAAPAAKP